MRTTLALDDDVFAFARAHAQRERISLGEAVSRLARQGIQAQNRAPGLVAAEPSSKYALLPARAEVITSEHVRALMDQEGL
ncbi:MAG: hypothetical protein KGL18_05875 [Burkholderiales bacterium]|nr:hypothetical protein [Burkholderiales bacterium]MDE1927089.1 hypothetical protein [Burkholderiales bacterium]MDE2158519.1 hypothetical protein [Burkholderiales bacterium]MDE2502491.1 hypothetical protein [Burkholderiales bacterium]